MTKGCGKVRTYRLDKGRKGKKNIAQDVENKKARLKDGSENVYIKITKYIEILILKNRE